MMKSWKISGPSPRAGRRDFWRPWAPRETGRVTPELIGQFGVGFYSAFIVADKVTLITRAAGSEKGMPVGIRRDGTYTIEDWTRKPAGRPSLLQLKKAEKDEQDFTDEWTIRGIVKRHSDFVAYPIVMDVEKTEPVLDAEGKPEKDKTQKVIREETLNSMKAIWTKNKNEVTEEEHSEFYQHISHDWNPPLGPSPPEARRHDGIQRPFVHPLESSF